MDNIWNTKVPIDVTLKELEDIIIALRMVNRAFNGDVRSELEERLSNLATKTKMSI